MGLAPRPRSAGEKGGGRSSVKGSEGKKAQRDARREAVSVGVGSSGAGKSVGKYPSLDWATVEDDVVHVCDLEGKITQAQATSFGYFSMGMHLPMAAAHAALDATIASQGGMVYVRVYTVPMELYIAKMEEMQQAEQAKIAARFAEESV